MGKRVKIKLGKRVKRSHTCDSLSGDALGAFTARRAGMAVFDEEIGGWVVRRKHSCALEINRKGGNGMWATCLPLARGPES